MSIEEESGTPTSKPKGRKVNSTSMMTDAEFLVYLLETVIKQPYAPGKVFCFVWDNEAGFQAWKQNTGRDSNRLRTIIQSNAKMSAIEVPAELLPKVMLVAKCFSNRIGLEDFSDLVIKSYKAV